MKRLNKFACMIVAATMLAGCAAQKSTEVLALKGMDAVGSSFTKYLTSEYKTISNNEHYEEKDYADGIHFARKGIASAHGDVVMPEVLDDWNLSNTNLIELTEARAALVDVLEAGTRELAPEKSAMAQARFDCWVETQEEDWNNQDPAGCKSQFYALLQELQALIPEPAPVVVPVPVAEVEPEVVPLEQAMFIVFFDWDKSDITSGASDVLDAVVAEVSRRQDVNNVVITGYTDTSGSKTYNYKLSQKRAQAIVDGLNARGIPTTMIRQDAKGESDMLVQTADNIRESANRRGQISLE